MSPVLFAVLALGFPPAEGTGDSATVTPPPAAENVETAPRTGPRLRDAVRETLRRWARPSDADAPQAAAEFLKLYAEIDRDSELAAGQKEYLRGKVRSRLTDLAQQIAKRAAIERRLARGGPANVELPDDAAVLAQRGGFGGGFGPGGGFGGGVGPGAFGGGFGMGGSILGNADDDHGQALVDLIQKTISPASWDVNGGQGSIYYWRPGRAIVVRATDEVHGNIGDVLRQIERAGN